MLLGRGDERTRVDRLLEEARAGRSGALVVRGEAGAGKSAVLEYAAECAGGARVVRALGVEAESAFAFAGLHELVLPLLDRLDDLPPVQADALRGALALAEAAGAGRFYVGAATLSLLAAAGGEGPLLCLVDDAHWLDRASADALAFAARRLDAEGVVMLFAARGDAGHGFAAPGVPELDLTGLDADAATALLGRESGAPVAADVGAQLGVATGGNPRALVDLARGLTPEQLTGEAPLPHPLPLGVDLAAAFAERTERLSEEGRQALVLAATADTQAMRVISRADAATRTGFEECEDAGLLAIVGGEVNFPHPLVRSTAYQRASPAQRRAAHRALADAFATDPRYGDRAAWHAAAATVDADEDVAARLERAAEATAARRAHVAAAAMFERAARLTPDANDRARRVYLAARSAWRAGQTARAARLLDETEPANGVVRADVAYLRSSIGETVDLLGEADAVEPRDPSRAALLLARAAETVPDAEAVAIARRALELADGGRDAAELTARLALARALASIGEAADAGAALAHARELLTGTLAEDPELILATVDAVAAVQPADDELARELLAAAIDDARSHAVAVLPRALVHAAWVDFAGGRWTEAYMQFAEAARLAGEAGRPRERVAALAGTALVDALSGRQYDTAELPAAEAARLAGLAALGEGRPAAESFEAATGARLFLRGLPAVEVDLVEARLRAGERAEAEAAARDVSSAWADALLGTASFDAALEEEAGRPFLCARVRLNAGELLRRGGERRAARAQLEEALAVFARLGAEPWAERCRRELQASGGSPHPRGTSGFDELTAQELQIAREIAAGAPYRDVAAKFFLSPKTVEYHLNKVYRKLGIRSRHQLARRLSELGLSDER